MVLCKDRILVIINRLRSTLGSDKTMDKPPDAGKYQVDNDGPVQSQVIGDNSTVHQHFMITSQPNRVRDQNRQRFLIRLSTRYQDVLEKSLQGAVLIALGLHTKPEAIAHPAHLVFRHLDQTEKPLPAGTSITQVYDQAGGELLILGEPGAGKSTLLVHLAQSLLTRAEQDQEHLLPVIFNLSSWAQKWRSLSEWLVEELLKSYQVPRKVGKLWVENGQILPLLDGLDEVAASARDLCIDAINTYRHDHLVPLVVCSRTSEYSSQEHRLVLQNAVVVQPLTTEQIHDYLETAGSQLVAVRTALQNNQVLRELAVSPLMLNVLTLTYRDASLGDLPVSGSVEEQQREVFAGYIKRMLGTNKTARSQQMLSWLSWLARQMQRNSQTVFYLEQLQPSWLTQEHWIWYELLAVRLPGIIIGVLLSLALSRFFFSDPMVFSFFGGLLGEIFSRGNFFNQSEGRLFWLSLLRRLSRGVFVGVGIGLSYGLSFGLSLGCSALLLQVLLRTRNQAIIAFVLPEISKGFLLLQRLMSRTTSYNAILVAFVVGLSYGLSVGLSEGLSVGLSEGLSVGLSLGLVGILLNVLLIGGRPVIQPADRLVWSWRSSRKSFFLKRHISISFWVLALIGLSVGLTAWLSVGPSHALSYGLSYGLSFGLVSWLLLGLFLGVSSETIEHQQRTIPNQGVSRSLSNGLVLGLVSTAIIGLIAFLSEALSFGLSYGLSVGLSGGLSMGLFVGLFNGGWTYLQHYTLRFLLWREGSIPWKLPQLLDEAARHILLHKIGGGYVFLHSLFLDYIASLDTSALFPLQRSESGADKSVDRDCS